MREEMRGLGTASWLLILRFVAGYINVMTVLNYSKMLAGHTGAISHASIQLAEGDFTTFYQITGMTLAFLIGAVVSGYLYRDKEFRPRQQLSWVFFIFGAILLAFNRLHESPTVFLSFVGFALGMQNAMPTYFRGMSVKTTILTGTLTDLGTSIGRILRRQQGANWKFIFHLENLLAFTAGGVAATYFKNSLGWNTLAVGGAIYVVLAAYFYFMPTSRVQQIQASLK
ncbi:YoaK family protein [Hutsoniella sourekii]